MDHTMLNLHMFAQRARTREAKLPPLITDPYSPHPPPIQEAEVLWLIEPDFHQYSAETQEGGGL
jgi:hypothetical protein